jgi:two-component system, LuxR family, sensor kinase FixL
VKASEVLLRLRGALDEATIWQVDAELETGRMVASPDLFVALGLKVPRDFQATLAMLAERTHPEDRAGAEAITAALRVGGPSILSSHRVVRADDGAVRWMRVLQSLRLDSAGRRRWVAVMWDITERRQLDDELMASEERLRLAVAAGGFATWDAVRSGLAGDDDDAVIWSHNYFTMLGYPVEPSGRASRAMWRSRVHPDDMARVMQAWERAETGDGCFQAKYRVRVPDQGERWVEAHGRVLRMPDGTRRSVGLVRDITAQHDAELRLRTLQGRAMRTSRLNAVGAMAASLAHELNQPLGAIANYNAAAMLMLRQPPASPETTPDWLDAVQAALRHASEQTRRAADIVRRLRDGVFNSEPDLSMVPVQALVEEACAVARASMPALFEAATPDTSVELVASAAPDLGELFVEQAQLQHVLVNLIVNGAEAVRGRSLRRVVVSAARVEDGRAVRFSVADSGPGFEKGSSERLFEAFLTGKPTGMGLGLAICRTIVESHGGRIWIEPEASGAVVSFVLPDPGMERAAG